MLGRAIPEWYQNTLRARAVYRTVSLAVAGVPCSAEQTGIAAAATASVWDRVLTLEGCAPALDAARRRDPQVAACTSPATTLTAAAAARALRNAVAAVQQLTELAELAGRVGVRVLVLKGAARLLAGEPAGTRSMADIDVLVDRTGGQQLHDAMRRQLGYGAETTGTPDRHLPALVRADGLPIEIHLRVRDDDSDLERLLWAGARRVPLGAGSVDIPDGTALLIHALDHAAVVHRALHFRLRDVLDTAALLDGDHDSNALHTFVMTHPHRGVLQTLLDVAAGLSPRTAPVLDADTQRRAWRRIQRVGAARLLAPARHDVPPTADPRVLILSQLAGGSLDTALRLAGRAVRRPGKALRVTTGAWLPVEARGATSDGVAGLAHTAMPAGSR